MTSIPGTDNLAWSDEQTRFYLQLRSEEKLKGNIRNQEVNQTGSDSIMDKFYDAYWERHICKKFGIKYESFKRLTRNKTGLGDDSTGYIDMPEDWWNERCKEWPGARKIKDKPVANMDLMEQVYGTVHISGSEGWAPQQGEKHFDTMNLDQDTDADAESRQILPTQDADADAESRQILPTQDADADAESRQILPTQDADADAESRQILPTQDADADAESRQILPTQDADADAESRQILPTQGNTCNGPSSSDVGSGPSSSSRSKGSRKRSRSVQAEEAVAEVIKDSGKSRDKILSHKNQLIESHPEFSCSQLRAMEVLHSLPTIKMWSPLYKAAIQHLKQDIANRQTFLFYQDDENKVLYLEFATGESRDA